MKAETRYLRKIKGIVSEEAFQERYTRNREVDFTRNRKLNFAGTMLAVIGNCRGPAYLEAERFSEAAGCKVSDTAIRKARAKIDPRAFYELFQRTAEVVPQEKKYHGYRLIAVDGMKGELPKTPELTGKYCRSGAQSPLFHAIAAYDVMNDVYLDALFYFGCASEHEYGVKLIDRFTERSEKLPRIWIFDRGFPSLRLLQHLNEQNENYVMRVSGSFLKEVNEFAKGKAVDKEVQICYTERRAATSRVTSDGELNFQLRCVRIKLDGQKDEILVTNLDRKEFPKRYLKEIYGLRWGIETAYNFLKNAVFVEEFTSRKEYGIQQDFYATLIADNFITCACGSVWADMPLKKSTNCAGGSSSTG